MNNTSTITSVKGRTFEISRAKWLRGQGANASRLLHSTTRTMCCFGQIALQCGYTEKDIENVPSPGILGWKELVRRENSLWSIPAIADMMEANDNPDTCTDAEREALLQSLAIKAGFSLTFAP